MARSALQVSQTDLRAINKELDKEIRRIKSFKDRREILEPAAPVIVNSVKQEVPVQKPIKRRPDLKRQTPPKRLKSDKTYRYKADKSGRAGPGYGVIVSEYQLGNLRESIVDLSEVKKSIKTYQLVIGPIYRRTKAKRVSLKKADGYYAHMVLGSALAFRKQIAEKGFNRVSGRVRLIVTNGLDKHFKKVGKRRRYLSYT